MIGRSNSECHARTKQISRTGSVCILLLRGSMPAIYVQDNIWINLDAII